MWTNSHNQCLSWDMKSPNLQVLQTVKGDTKKCHK